jgi:hypothetical protein
MPCWGALGRLSGYSCLSLIDSYTQMLKVVFWIAGAALMKKSRKEKDQKKHESAKATPPTNSMSRGVVHQPPSSPTFTTLLAPILFIMVYLTCLPSRLSPSPSLSRIFMAFLFACLLVFFPLPMLASAYYSRTHCPRKMLFVSTSGHIDSALAC